LTSVKHARGVVCPANSTGDSAPCYARRRNGLEGTAIAVSAVLFDVPTALVYGPSGPELIAELLAMEEIEATPAAVAAAVQQLPAELLQLRAAMRTEEEETAYHAQALPFLLRLMGLSVTNAVLNRLIENLYNYSAFYSLYPEVTAVLAELHRRGVTLGAVANWEPSLPRFLRDFELAHYFAAILSSRAAGYAKPDPRLFQDALRQSGVQAAEAVHVGGNLVEDVAGAAAAGIRPVWLNRHGDPSEPECLTIVDLRGLLVLVRGEQ
jgi:HAD superfamily hydrolase (TIGR01509 family)